MTKDRSFTVSKDFGRFYCEKIDIYTEESIMVVLGYFFNIDGSVCILRMNPSLIVGDT